MTRAELKAAADEILAADGFKDIESPSGKSVKRLPMLSLTDTHCNNNTESLYDTAKAEYWRVVGRAAAEMSPQNSLYILVNAFADTGSFTAAAQEAGIGYNVAANRIRRWLDHVGVSSRPGGKRKRKAQHEGS